MRLLVALIAVQLVFSGASVVAEPLADRVVRLLKDVCVSPATPEAMMSAGESLAAAEKWKLISSGPTPLPMMHNDNGPKVSFGSGWEMDLPDGPRSRVMISIVRPELPDLKHSVCVIQPSVDIDRDELIRAIAHQFGSAVIRDPSRQPASDDVWFFAEEKAAGNCGKKITVLRHQTSSRGTPKTLMFTDFAYPDDGRAVGAFASTRCRF